MLTNKIFQNKNGADKILSIYWFAILFIIATGIFAMVYVFYKTPFDVRGIESEILASRIAECVSQQGKIDSQWISENPEAADLQIFGSCQTEQECQKIIGTKLVSIVSSVKSDTGILNIDESVKQEEIAENFECLVLQIATQESSLRHCVEFQKNGNPLYCDGKREEVKSLDNERETSLGVLQVNTKVHDVDSENFEEGIIYGVEKVLIQQYEASKSGRLFEPTQKYYSGWKAAIRGYNGWGSGGDDDYVENVLSQKQAIQNMFPEFCSQGILVEPTKKNLQQECSINFKSEFDDEQFYIQVDFYNLAAFETENQDGRSIINSKPIATIFDGNQNLKADCEIQKEKEFEKQSKCFEGRFYAVDENNLPHVVRILSVVRKTEKNAI